MGWSTHIVGSSRTSLLLGSRTSFIGLVAASDRLPFAFWTDTDIAVVEVEIQSPHRPLSRLDWPVMGCDALPSTRPTSEEFDEGHDDPPPPACITSTDEREPALIFGIGGSFLITRGKMTYRIQGGDTVHVYLGIWPKLDWIVNILGGVRPSSSRRIPVCTCTLCKGDSTAWLFLPPSTRAPGPVQGFQSLGG